MPRHCCDDHIQGALDYGQDQARKVEMELRDRDALVATMAHKIAALEAQRENDASEKAAMLAVLKRQGQKVKALEAELTAQRLRRRHGHPLSN